MSVQLFLVHIRVGTDYVDYDLQRYVLLLHYKKELQEMVKPLMEWYKKGHRNLPWREDPKAYHVWISEIMLQQTRVEAVKPYYHRFMKQVPDLVSLAYLEENQLLKLWEGLGYYNRARNLQKAAKLVVEEYQGVMPKAMELIAPAV